MQPHISMKFIKFREQIRKDIKLMIQLPKYFVVTAEIYYQKRDWEMDDVYRTYTRNIRAEDHDKKGRP